MSVHLFINLLNVLGALKIIWFRILLVASDKLLGRGGTTGKSTESFIATG